MWRSIAVLLALPALAAAATPADLALAKLGGRPDWEGVTCRADVWPQGGPAGASGVGPRGAVVRLQPQLQGLPVDVDARVVVDASGAVVSASIPDLPRHDARGPVLDQARALAVARGRFPSNEAWPRLSWRPVGDVLRRVWSVELAPSVPDPQWRRPILRLDAESGFLLAVDEGASFSQNALVYPENPWVDRDTTVVPLPDTATGLFASDRMVQQCRDERDLETYEIDGVDWAFHVCTPDLVDVTQAAPGLTWTFEPVPFPDDPGRDEDDFAGPNAFWNTGRGLDWFRERGWTPLPGYGGGAILVTVNYRVTDLWSSDTASKRSSELEPYDNAWSAGGYPYDGGTVEPEMVFGQGSPVDFAYDADVVLHELGHFVVRTRDGAWWSPDTDFGPSIQAAAVNEALADYFSSAVQGDGQLGEYAGEGRPVRDLDGWSACSQQIGEPHADGQPLSQALWGFRTSLADDTAREKLDEAVIDALTAMGPNASLSFAASAIDDQVSRALSLDDARALNASFEDRGLHPCDPVVPVPTGPRPFAADLVVPSHPETDSVGPVPGYVQLQVDVPAGGAELTLRGNQARFLGLDPYGTAVPGPLVVVGRSGDRITWTSGAVDATVTTPDGYAATVPIASWQGDGAVEAELQPTGEYADDGEYRLIAYQATWTVTQAGTYTFQLANAVSRTADLRDPTIELAPLVHPPAGCDTAATGEGWLAPGVLLLAARARRRRTGDV